VNDHLTAFALDALVAGEPNEVATAHVADCAACRARLDAHKLMARQVSSMPQFEQTFSALDFSPPAASTRPPRRRWPAVLAVAVPLAAVLVFLIASPRRDDGTRLKGTPTLEVLLDDQPVTRARPGDTIGLAVGGAGSSHGLVLAIDEAGAVSRLWPQADVAAPIAAGARVPLSPTFDVTPGSLVLLAVFTDAPQPVAPVIAAVERQLAAGRSPLQLELPAFWGRTASLALEVGP
jgi:hypothetical protein